MRSGLRVVRSAGVSLVISLLLISGLSAQQGAGSITGKVSDPSQGVLGGARIELQPGGRSAQTDANGEFSIKDINTGRYTVTVSHEGFGLYSIDVIVNANSSARVDAILQVGTHNEVVTVTGERQGGEIEALTIERTADNIVQVLPADVITSLPNTNIADAVGRMPSVSLERDEGEGKYIQIRGTEPRLSNVTVNGIHLPSPEQYRNVKLDVIPADLVSSVEINKTLSANQDADAIGGSVNLVTRTPADQPYLTFLGMGGYTPITGGRHLYQVAGTAGQRFGPEKKFGALFGFSYDYNSRGIDDVEPGPAINTLSDGSTFLGPNTEDLRNYHYDRSRYGLDGELDYKLGDWSSVYIRGLFSHFNDYGEDWIYTPSINNFLTTAGLSDPTQNTCGLTTASQSGNPTGCGNMSFTNVYRHPGQQIFSVQAGARHVFGGAVLNYEAALSQANYTGGFGYARYYGLGASNNSPANNVGFAVDTTNPHVPKFPVLSGQNIYDPSNYFLGWGDDEHDGIFERDAVGDISLSKPYKLAGHFSTFEVGFKGWDARKTSVINRAAFDSSFAGLPMTDFLGSYRDNHYYFGQYQFGPTTLYRPLLAQVSAIPLAPESGYNLPNDFNISERIWAGYVTDTIDLGKFRLQGGVRLESTADDLQANSVMYNSGGNFVSSSPLNTTHSYINAFPSVQAQYRFTSDTVLRATYGMGIARPNFSGLAPYLTFTPGVSVPYAQGNPNLKPTHAQNFDLLAEHYMKSVGIVQAGFFYKYLTDPIYPITGTFNGAASATLNNGPNAHILGFEATWQQRLTFMPGALNGMGVSANYGYTTSRATFPAGGRSDHPTLVRTAPNNWNFDVTYDKKGLSARMGLTHNDAYIWSYGGSNAKDPSGDTYLYPHTQVDAQVSYWIPKSHGLQAIVSLLNLNNETFGFYNGAERYPIQREYYSRTISAGLRWTLNGRESQ